MNRSTIYVMCGYPGAGKTYFAKNYLVQDGCTYISSDDIRAEICDDVQDQSKNYEVFEIFYARARQAVENGKDVVLDATHLTRKARRRSCKRFKGLRCRFIAVQLTTPVKEAMRRNKSRDRVVPNYAMNRMIESWEPVEDDEGFDEVWRVK